MWYKFSQQSTPWDNSQLKSNPYRAVWQDQNYYYFMDDNNQKRSISKSSMGENQAQQFFGKPVPHTLPSNRPVQKGHHNFQELYNQTPSHMPTYNQQPNEQQYMQNMVGPQVQQYGNMAVIQDPFTSALEQFFPGGKLPQGQQQQPFINPSAFTQLGPTVRNPINGPVVTPNGRETVLR